MLAAFVEPATARPTGSMSDRPPGAVAWIASARLTAKSSKTSTSTRWTPTPSSGYAAGLHGKQTPWKEAEGDTVFTMVSFCPLVLSDSLGTDASEVRDPTKTPLMHAAESGDIELTRNLINSGADVNATDQNGKTALFYALKSSGEAAREVTQLLLAAGAKANVADRDGYTLLMRAATNGEIGVVRLLRSEERRVGKECRSRESR